MMHKIYRKGPIGAMMDEYERAAQELVRVVNEISDMDYEKIFDAQTANEDCRSVQTIMSHVVYAARWYVHSIREAFSLATEKPVKKQLSKQEALKQLGEVLAYTAASFEGKWDMTDDDTCAIMMNVDYPESLEQKMEHAIVHILRHRRQIEKFLASVA